MHSTVYVTVERPSVCLSHSSTAATAAGGFAAERPAGRRHQSTAAGAVLQGRWPSAANAGSITFTAQHRFVCLSKIQIVTI